MHVGPSILAQRRTELLTMERKRNVTEQDGMDNKTERDGFYAYILYVEVGKYIATDLLHEHAHTVAE